jgi:MFS family permease
MVLKLPLPHFCSGFSFGGLLDTGMTMLVKERYGLSSRGAALIFIAAVVPSFISSPMAGHYADKYGAKWPIVICLILGTPFFGLLSMNTSLAALITFIAFTGRPFFRHSEWSYFKDPSLIYLSSFIKLQGIFIMGIAAPIMQGEILSYTPQKLNL